MESIALALPLLLGVLNRYPRGVLAWGPYPIGALLGVIVYLASSNLYASAATTVFYILGESFGWGKWLSVVPRWDDSYYTQKQYNESGLVERKDGKSNGVHWLASKVAKETEDFRKYSKAALAIRGFYWYAPIFAALAILGVTPIWLAIVLSVAVGLLMPVSYYLAYLVFGEGYWPGGEHIFGVVQGIALALALTV